MQSQELGETVWEGVRAGQPRQAVPSRFCLASLLSRLIILCKCDWLSGIPGFPTYKCKQQQKGKTLRKKMASELNIRLDLSYLLSLSNMVQPHLHILYIVLDMKVIQGQFHISRRMCLCSMQISCHCKRDFVLCKGGDTWHPSLVRILRSGCAHRSPVPPWSSLEVAGGC